MEGHVAKVLMLWKYSCLSFTNSISRNLFYRNNLGHAQEVIHETIY